MNIPPCYPFAFEAVEDSRMMDLDCAMRLQDLLEEVERLEAKEPEKLRDEAYMKTLKERFNCWYEPGVM